MKFTHLFDGSRKFKYSLIPEIIVHTLKQMQEANLLMVASSLAYTTILSIIPVLAVSFAIFKAFGGMEKLYQNLEPFVLSHLAAGSGQEVVETLHYFIDKIHAGAVGLGGLIGLIFTTMSMLYSIEKSINHVWKVPMQRKIFYRISAYWFIITLGPLAMSIAVGAATSSEHHFSRFFPSGTGLYLLSVLLFFWMYKWVPEVQVKWHYALCAAMVASLFWNLARIGYAYYIKKVVSYHAIYGSLGAIPIFLLWVYIIWVIVLGGASFTAALQKRADFSSLKREA